MSNVGAKQNMYFSAEQRKQIQYFFVLKPWLVIGNLFKVLPIIFYQKIKKQIKFGFLKYQSF